MKTIIKVIFAIVLLIQMSLAQEVFDNIYDAILKAQQQNKLTLFFILSSTCSHCHKLITDINSNRNLMNLINRNFIVAITDIARGGKIPPGLPFDGFTPTILLLTPKGELVVNPIKGEVPSNALMNFLLKIEKLNDKIINNN